MTATGCFITCFKKVCQYKKTHQEAVSGFVSRNPFNIQANPLLFRYGFIWTQVQSAESAQLPGRQRAAREAQGRVPGRSVSLRVLRHFP
jgi:hypothetical protein